MWKKSKLLKPKIRSHSQRFRLLWPMLVLIALIGFFILCLSIFFALRISGSPWEKLLVKDYFWIIVLLMAGIFLGISFDEVHHHGWREIWEIFKPAFTLRFFIYFLLIFGAGLLTILVSPYLNPTLPGDTFFWKSISALTLNPGGIFALFTGVATLLALGLTMHSLMEFKRTVASFTDLIYRLCDMLDNASPDDPFRMVCYTPALGCLALPDKVYKMYFSRLCSKVTDEEEPRAEIICLGPTELEHWHGRFKGRGTQRKVKGHVVNDYLLSKAKDNSAEIVSNLNRGRDPYLCDGEESRVKYLPHQFMPGFYFFFTNKRAIIVAPFFLQNPKGAPMLSGPSGISVEMIGFETTDMGIISTLQKMYDRYKTMPSRLVGEVSEPVEIQELEKLQSFKNEPSLTKMVEGLKFELQKSKTGDYSKLFKSEKQKVELNMRLLYMHDQSVEHPPVQDKSP